MKRNIFTLMALLWMGIIFWFSAQPADQSERMSLSVGHVAGLLFVDGYEDWPQERQEAFEEEIDHGVRKALQSMPFWGCSLLPCTGLTDTRGNASFCLPPGPALCMRPRMSSTSCLCRGGAARSQTG